MIGYIGLVMLVFGYTLMLTRYRFFMVPVNAVASIVLTIHAYILGDIPFIIVNGLVACILCITYIQDRKKNGKKEIS
jgi:hypothetical protein